MACTREVGYHPGVVAEPLLGIRPGRLIALLYRSDQRPIKRCLPWARTGQNSIAVIDNGAERGTWQNRDQGAG